jgi:hypothetical protein
MASAVILAYSLLTMLRPDEVGVSPAGATPPRAFAKPVGPRQ